MGKPSSATNAHLETHRVKDKYKLQQTFSVNPVYLRHADSGAATDFMVSGQERAAWQPLRWKRPESDEGLLPSHYDPIP